MLSPIYILLTPNNILDTPENCTIKDMSVVKPYSKNRGRKVRKDFQFVLNTNFSLFL